MKKHLLKILSTCLIIPSASIAQDIKEDKAHGLPSKTNFVDQSTIQVPQDFNRNSAFVCDTMLTTMAGGNGQDGNMFDITAVQNVVITQFSQAVGNDGWFKIYYRTNSFVGFDTTSAGWIFIDSALVSGSTVGVPYLLPINVNVTIPAGQTYGFYITGSDGLAAVDYTNGTAVGNVYRSDAYIQFKEGHGGVYPFNVTYKPRIWNGIIHYCDQTTGIENNLRSAQGVTVSPNPLSESSIITFRNSRPFQGSTFELFDLTGKKVVTEISVSGNSYKLNKGDLAPGLYSFRFINQSNVLANGRIVVE